MKSVMLSIQPKYCELIASGKTTGERKIQFKACGGKHKCDKPYADGRERWKYEDANFYVWSGHPLAKTVRALQVGDCIEVHGVLGVSNYISATGKQKRYFEWKLEKLVVLYHQDGNLPTNEEYTPAEVDESELDELFDDL